LIIDPSRPDHVHSPPAEPIGVSRPPRKLPSHRPPTGGALAPDESATLFPSELFDRANSVFIYGPSRPLVNLALYAFAQATTPDFQWLDIGVPGEERTAFDPVRLGWISGERLWKVERPDALRPNDLTANLPISSLIRSDEAPAALTHLSEFLRLPDTSQRILATRPNDGRPGALAVANAHRVMAAFSPERVAPILAVHRNAGFSVFVGYSEAAGPGRNFFDFVFRLDCKHIAEWRKGHLVCEKGIDSGPLRDSRPVPLGAVPMLVDVLSRAMSSR
jgi:hypothetical protein